MKRLRLVIIAFVLILTASIVYAAASGEFTFTGTGTLTNAKLEIESQPTGQTGISASSSTASGAWGTCEGTTARVSATLGEEGDYVEFTFALKNNSPFAVEMYDDETEYDADADEALFITVDYVTTPIAAGASTNVKIKIERIGDNEYDGNFTFTVTIKYKQVATP